MREKKKLTMPETMRDKQNRRERKGGKVREKKGKLEKLERGKEKWK